jgi:serine/threonine protein kinase
MPATITCLHCGGDLDSGDRFCAHCGAESVACLSCARMLLSTDLSCPHCGAPAQPAVPHDPFSTSTEPSSPMADIVERLRRATLGEFEVGRELGRGGMAAVFLAHEISLDRKVAIKVMSPGLLLGEGMVERFKHEAITIAQLQHANIVSVYSVRQAEGLHFFVMRYVQGRSLEQIIQQAGRLPLPIARSILAQVGSALTYAHRARVVHRDIKPANILIDQDGNAVVTDFGIAKAAERPSHTLTGALVGTPAYMSPEQCSGGEVSGASDQYSLGAVAYELVTGVAPFSGSTLTVMQAHVERTPRPVRELCGDCPPEVDAAIMRMLDKDPAARWPRIADAMAALGAEPLAEDDPLRAELSRHAASSGGATLSDAPTPTSPAPRTRASAAGGVSARPVGGISIMPAPAGLEVGDSFTLVAVIRGQHGTRLPPRSVEWSTDAPGVLRLDDAGVLATALAPGTAILTATCKGVSALLRVEVAAPKADDVVIEPMNEPLHVGDEIRLEATPRDKRGWPVYRMVAWESADPDVAAVTAHGTIAGRAPGTVRITAALDDASASIVIPVLPARVAAVTVVNPPTSVAAGRNFGLVATPLDRMRVPLPGRAVLWGSSDVHVAMVTAEGLVAALRPGSVVLTATCEGASASVRVTIVPPPAPPPAPAAAPRRRSRRSRPGRLMAAVAAGAILGATLWSLQRERSGDSAAATPAATQGYTASRVGVDSAGPAAVVITRRPVRALRPDSVLQLAAEVRDSAGRPVAGATVAWSSRDSTIARVDPGTGAVRALRPGRTTILASSGDRRDSVPMLVRRRGSASPVVASVAVAPHGTLRAGETTTLTAVVIGPKGDTLAGAEVMWASSDPRIATVEPVTGVLRALSPGSALILARSGDETTMSELTVLPGAVAVLQILGGRPMAVGEMLPLRVLARDAWGHDIEGDPVTWTSADSSVAAVDEWGAVVGRVPGSTRITATSGRASDRIYLTVLPRPEPVHGAAGGAEEQAWVEAGVDECYAALRAKDVGRLTALYHPATKADRAMLKRLSEILGADTAAVGPRVDGDRQLGPEDATMEFSVQLSWTGPSNQLLTGNAVFRAEFGRSARGWEMSSCRVVGSPKL